MAVVKLNKVRLSFPDLFVAKKYEDKPGSKARYNATFLIEPNSANDKAVQAAIKEVAAEVWKAKAGALLESLRGNSNKYCYTKGDLKEYEGYQGMLVLASHRNEDQRAPLLLTANKLRIVFVNGVFYGIPSDKSADPSNHVVLTAEEVPYAGCYVNAQVEIWAQTGQYTGIRCKLNGIQFHSDGDAFAGGSAASTDDFDDLSDGAQTTAPEDLV